MNDDIVEVQTGYADVAELGQGYIERVDGERILLPLSVETPLETPVRFIVHLVDGTPAFAGTGRCIQVSDQGDGVATSDRYETLLDALEFDERSAPVYEYIVAVRQMAYSEQAAEPAAEESYAVDDTSFRTEAVTATSSGPLPEARDPAESLAPVSAVEAVTEPSVPPEPEVDDQETSFASTAPQTPLPPALQTPPPEVVPSVPPSRAPGARSDAPRPHAFASLAPAALPTGILTRPAISAQWAAVAARPQPTLPRSTQYQTAPGPLKIPAAPPRPQLDRSQWVERAAAP